MDLSITLLKFSGIASFSWIGGIAGSWICFNAIETGLSASYGTLPVTISYITIPREYISVLVSTTLPLACSGEK